MDPEEVLFTATNSQACSRVVSIYVIITQREKTMIFLSTEKYFVKTIMQENGESKFLQIPHCVT